MGYREEGYEVIHGLLKNDELEPIREVIAQEVDRRAEQLYTEGKITDKFGHLPFNKRWAAICAMHRQRTLGWNREVFSKAIYDLCTNPKLLGVIEDIIGPEIMVNGDYWVRPKLPNEELTTLPWHQDSNYYGGIDAGSPDVKIISVWIPLVDVDNRNGCLQVIPGSNKWGLVPSVQMETGHKMPAVDVEQKGKPLSLAMKVGDALIFDQLTMHRSQPNWSDEIRWSIDLRYSPADQPFTWASVPNFDEYYPGMIARSPSKPERVMGFDEWYAKHLRRLG